MSDHNAPELNPTPGERFTKFLKRKDVLETLGWAVFYTTGFVILGGKFYTKWMPTMMSTDMRAIERLMVIFTWISAPVCGFVLSMATYTFRHGHRGDTPPEDGPATRTNRLGISLFGVMSSLLALVAILYGLIELNSSAEAATKDAPNAMVVEVTGSQWVWSFNYPAQGVTSNELMLPINKPVIFKIISEDVNHSFWPVQLGVKADANRYQTTTVQTKPNKLGAFDVKCAELCGLYHAYMETNGAVVTTADFNNWVTAQGGHTA
jgi:cytochrome c oxidase subunit 2